MVTAVGGRCSRSRRIIFACWANMVLLTRPCCPPENPRIRIRVLSCWVGSLTRSRLRLRCRPLSDSSCACSSRSGHRLSVAGMDDISINVLVNLGMIVSGWVLVFSCAERPSATGDCVLLRGDKEAAVQWVRWWRGGNQPRSDALMRLRGLLELFSGWHFDSKHVRGIFQVAADGISRWDHASVLLNLRSVRPDVPWHARNLGNVGKSLCT